MAGAVAPGFAESLPSTDLMALIPRWRYMTDEAKALTRRTVVSAAVLLLVLLLFPSLLPWVVLAVLAWWAWKAFSR